MKRKTTLVLSVITLFVFQISIAQQTPKITPDGVGYYEYLPDGYHSNSNKYPVVIFLHGYKEKGTSSKDPKLVFRDLPRAAYVGLPKYVRQGKKYPFILISPQLKSQYGTWPPSYIIQVLNHARKTLRVDDKRIYLTGLSLGGFGVWKTAGEYPKVFAAIGPICAGGNAISKADDIARENVAVWAFHGGSDRIVSDRVTTSMVNAINSAPKKPNPLAKVTIFPGMGHIIWDKAYHDTDLLKWMLSVRNGSPASQPEPPPNSPPVANAGSSITIALPTNTTHLKGSASDKDGEIVSFRWTKTSGGKATLHDADKRELRITDLEEGTYVFRLTVKDNDGASDADEVTVTVKGLENKAPIVDAGSSRSVTLPEDEVVLSAKAKDPDGKIASYQWRKISGASAKMSGAESSTLRASGLTEGTYVFRLTVKDNHGVAASDDVTVKVNEAETHSKPPMDLDIVPVVNRGAGRSLPAKSGKLPKGVRGWLRW